LFIQGATVFLGNLQNAFTAVYLGKSINLSYSDNPTFQRKSVQSAAAAVEEFFEILEEPEEKPDVSSDIPKPVSEMYTFEHGHFWI